jgi:hypothetical protein
VLRMCAQTNFLVFPRFQIVTLPVAPRCRFPGVKEWRVSGTLSDTTRCIRCSPYRFGVEFWDVGLLREKLHLYLRTIWYRQWYAGSLLNVFVEMFRKKAHGPQLGVYLRRQIAQILSLRCRDRPDRFLLINRQTTSPIRATSHHLL